MILTRIVVIGAGTMGLSIAQWFAQQMCFVELVGSSSEKLAKALHSIHSSWDKLALQNKLDAGQVSQMKKLLTVLPLEYVSTTPDLVIEAISEDLEVKKELFHKLDYIFSTPTIIASNTSSFPITQLAESVSKERRARFIGLHFFNPATIMQLVEIIKGETTDESLCRDLYQWFEARAKKPAFCNDSPGFIVNRVARSFYGEPLRIVENDNESRMREVDRILKEVGGFKMGPFELMDLIGIDVSYSVTCTVWKAYGKEPRFAPHPLQRKMVEENRLGRKTKRGFYIYD